MTHLIYDGSFEGFLTAVFESYDRKLGEVKIVRYQFHQPELGSDELIITPDTMKATRVWLGIKKTLSPSTRNEVFKTFLSELPEIETILLAFIRDMFSMGKRIEKDYGNTNVLTISQVARKVHREKHRMEAFVRFQRTRDDIYFSSITPDFNVLPLIVSHFKDRYADQHWVIYDMKRKYGIMYNKDTAMVDEVCVDLVPEASNEFLPASMCHEEEPVYQQLWKDYFQSVNIGARKNLKLHLRHIPTRYWKFLTEKRINI